MAGESANVQAGSATAPSPADVGFSVTLTVLGQQNVTVTVPSLNQFDAGAIPAIVPTVSADLGTVLGSIQAAINKSDKGWTFPKWLTNDLDNVKVSFSGWYRKLDANASPAETQSSFSFQLSITDSSLFSNLLGEAGDILSDLINVTEFSINVTRGTMSPKTT